MYLGELRKILSGTMDKEEGDDEEEDAIADNAQAGDVFLKLLCSCPGYLCTMYAYLVFNICCSGTFMIVSF
ncbi:hypothetical protein A2U01_0096183 [Trifolium medium]|uniref:Uncharacterized protein n=1 Tax=Trifolium medium TaxID=97028 RepID=A0A392UQA5_9FABA|nr:hypothetical protein [Trifolium medium]